MALTDMSTAELKAQIARLEREVEAKRRVLRFYGERIKEIDAELEVISSTISAPAAHLRRLPASDVKVMCRFADTIAQSGLNSRPLD